MLIPFHTDAPVYHFPFGTIGLIGVNSLVYLLTFGSAAMPGDLDSLHWLCLQFHTINPWQWLTSNFMHAGPIHLLGNMFFLWGFGLIVEGKLGWWKFLLLYLAVGITQSAIEQTLMVLLSSSKDCALGASGAIYGLMAMAMLWAPKNEVHCVFFLGLRPRRIDLPVVGFAGSYVALQAFFFVLGGFRMSSEALHLTGFLVGLAAGVLLLHSKVVDCEGWDLFTVYFKSDEQQRSIRQRRRSQSLAKEVRESQEKANKERAQAVQAIRQAIEAKNPVVAVALYDKFAELFQHGQALDTSILAELANAMHQLKKWETSVPLLVELLHRLPPERAVTVRIKLAQILLQVTDQPRQAWHVLNKLPQDLPEKFVNTKRQLLAKAEAEMREGSYEAEVQDW